MQIGFKKQTTKKAQNATFQKLPNPWKSIIRNAVLYQIFLHASLGDMWTARHTICHTAISVFGSARNVYTTQGTARGRWILGWNNAYLKLAFFFLEGEKWNLYACVRGKGHRYFILGSSQLKKGNGLCRLFPLGRLSESTWDKKTHEREKPPQFKCALQVFKKKSCDKCSSSL